MKVIRVGNTVSKKGWKRTVVCMFCDAELEIEFFDLQTKTKAIKMEWDTYDTSYTFVKCPECGSEIQIRDLPKFREE